MNMITNLILLKNDELHSLKSQFKKIEEEYKSKQKSLEAEYAPSMKQLLKKIEMIKCNHTGEDGKSTWEYDGQDPGSGRSEHVCSICHISN